MSESVVPDPAQAAPASAGALPWPGRSARHRYRQGVLATPLALAAAFALSALLGVPSPLEPLAEVVMQATPVGVANALLDTLGTFARTAALLGALALALAAGGLLALAAPGAGAESGTSRWLWPRWAAVGLLALLVALPLMLAAPYPGQAWAATLAALLYVPALALVRWWEQRRVRRTTPAGVHSGASSRRAFLGATGRATVQLGLIVALGAYDLWSGRLNALLGRGEVVRRLFPFTPPEPRTAGFPLAGVAPEVTPVPEFYLLSKNDTDPLIAPEDWLLRVEGAVRRPLRLRYETLLALPREDVYVTLRCVNNPPDGQLMSTALWSGVSLARVLDAASVDRAAQGLRLHAPDGYDEVVPLAEALAGGALLAYGMNGESLPRRHGGPVRALVPGYFGFKHVKWLQGLTVTPRVTPGYWASRGWTAGRVHSVARIDVCRPASGGLLVAGVAFTGTRGVSAVQARLDGGSWQEARLNVPPLSPSSWVQWRVDLVAAPGQHVVQARVLDGAGVAQESRVSPVYPDGATGLDSVRIDL
jgi:DMSO/TMAO reductase YedYZ molybdopterin-dependent catalytic subunit